MKKSFLLWLLLILFIKIECVEANQVSIKNSNTNLYFYLKEGVNASIGKYYVFQDSSNYHELYSLDPIKNLYLKKDFEVINTNQWEYLNISQELWNRLEKIAYFGYGYKNHVGLEWFQVTNYMIHQTLNQKEMFLTSSFSINDKVDYSYYISEIDDLIDSLEILPSFSNNVIECRVNDIIKLKDENLVLNEYEVIDSSNVDAKIDDNTLIISKLVEPGNFKIILKKGEYKPFSLYYYKDSSFYQSFMDMNGEFQQIIELSINVFPKTENKVEDASLEEKTKEIDIKDEEKSPINEEFDEIEIEKQDDIKIDIVEKDIEPVIIEDIAKNEIEVEQDEEQQLTNVKDNNVNDEIENISEDNNIKVQEKHKDIINPHTKDTIVFYVVLLFSSIAILIKIWKKMH